MAFLQRLEVFDATMLMLGGVPVVEDMYASWLGEGTPDESSNDWECSRKYDFPNMTVTLERADWHWDEKLYGMDGEHTLRIERYVGPTYVDTAYIPVQRSFKKALATITKLLEEPNDPARI